jgi:4-oxalocrotonate tautomerase
MDGPETKRAGPMRPAKQARHRTRAPGEEETAMPFVNIRILEGHSQQRKDEISRRVTDAISSIAEVPKEAIWVVWEDARRPTGTSATIRWRS